MTFVPDEEPWEAEIGAMLGGLPAVEPPPGFIASALDHRPLYAGRVLLGLLAASVVAVAAVVVTNAAATGPTAPPIDELARRHESVVRAGVIGPLSGDVGYRVDTPVEMPAGFERTGNLAAEDLRQAVYARGDEAVSVFVLPGRVQWELLDGGELTEIDGLRAWVDHNRRLTVVEASNRTVTIVGLSADEAAAVVATMPRSGPSLGQRAEDTARSVIGQLGFPG